MEKLTLQGNFYPMASAAYIEDERTRLTLFGAQALGVASLESGIVCHRHMTNPICCCRIFGSDVGSSFRER